MLNLMEAMQQDYKAVCRAVTHGRGTGLTHATQAAREQAAAQAARRAFAQPTYTVQRPAQQTPPNTRRVWSF